MKSKRTLTTIITLFTAFAVGFGLFVNHNVKPTRVEATQNINNYDSYSYSGSYYNTIDFSAAGGMNGALRTSLTTLIRPAAFYTYSGTGTNYLSTQLQYADEDPTNNQNMVYLYTRDSVEKNAAVTWNREHVWPQSLSNGNWGTDKGGTDLLHLRPTYNSTNSSRGNTPYGDTNKTNPKYYDVEAGAITNDNTKTLWGYLSGSYFEPLDAVKGDVARIIMYLWTTYSGYPNYSALNILDVFQSYDVLLRWHTQDRPDALEGHRNDYVESSNQHNRNPFVDHPELAWKIFGNEASENVKNACMNAYPAGEVQQVVPTGVELSRDSATIVAGNTLQLTASLQPNNATGSITWSSSDNNVATVNATGLVTAVAAGNATITARVSENISATCTITVTANNVPADPYTKVASYDFSSNSASNSECTAASLLTLFTSNAATNNGLSNIVTAMSGVSKVYPAYSGYTSFGLKFGSSSANGTFTAALTERVARVVVNTVGWGTTDNLKIGSAAAQTPGVAYNGNNPIKTFTYDIEPSTSVTFTYAKRGFIKTIDFYTVQEGVSELLSYSSSIFTITGNEATTGESTTSSITFADAGIANAAAIGTRTFGAATLTAGSGPKYYSSDSSMRIYKSNTFTISASEAITSITFTYVNGYASGLTVSVGTLSSNTWTGNATSITFTNSNNDNTQVRLTAISVNCGETVTTVSNVVMRFGGSIPVDSWTAINNDWPITDYGVMIVKESTLTNTYNETSVEDAFRHSKTVANFHSGSGVAPTPHDGTYAFTARVNMTNVNNYNVVYCAAPYIVADDEYYFLEEMRYSVNTLAAYCLSNSGNSSLSNAALNVLSGN